VFFGDRRSSQKGQALILSALLLSGLLCFLALTVDVGWSFYIGHKAQTAADAAAISAASEALEQMQTAGTAPCAGNIACQASSPCPGTANLAVACEYAGANGFTSGGADGTQSVQIAAGSGQTAPGVPSVPVLYWVQVVAQQARAAWFAGMFGGGGLTPAASAVAAVRSSPAASSLYLLNQASDCFASAINLGVVCGEDFLALGGNTLSAPGGIQMASSNANGLGLPQIAAGTVVGFANVQAPYTYLVGNGGIQTIGGTTWNSAPVNGFPGGDTFADPMAGKGQPPPPTGLADHPVPGGVIVGSLLGNPTVLPPGNYFATTPGLLGGTPTGTPVTITGNVVFSDGQATPCGGFCNYVFYGGIVTGALSSVTFSPGRYVFAGAQPVAGAPGLGLSVGVNGKLQDLTPLVSGNITANTDAGEIFVFTNSSYPGLVLPNALASSGLSFPQVQAGIMAGLEPQITLHGLNASNAALPQELSAFAPAVIWQDQANTTLKFTSSGLLDTSCGTICPNVLSVPGSQEMVIMAAQNGGQAGTNLYGMIYLPRAAWLTVLGLLPGDTISGPLQIIAGALQMTLNTNVQLQTLPTPVNRTIVSLIQ
jgi:Flp pilus assembly protein TadG